MYQPQAELEFIVVEPSNGDSDATIIWLHGLGADGEDFVGVVDQLGLPATHNIKFIFPHAPYRAITINGGMSMRGWYDLSALELDIREDLAGIKQSQQAITALIEQELATGLSARRIILAGFSQGGAIALYVGLRFKQALGGIIALSTYQLDMQSLPAERNPNNQALPIFMAHGMFDPVVPFSLGQQGYQQMLALDYPITWHTYPIQHTVSAAEIQQIGGFIKTVLHL